MVFPERQTDGSQIWKLRGIVSNTKPNDDNSQYCIINNYIIVTDIAQYMDWIDLRLI